MLLAALMLILPMALSAAGAQEGGNSKAITLDDNVMTMLEQLEAGDLTLEQAREDFRELEKEYQVSAEEQKQINGMMDDVAKGDRTAQDCEEPLKDQFQTREKIQEKVQDKTQDQTPDQTKDQLKTGASEGSGSSGSGSGKK
jgi:pyruvate formate-lyase activating enzyme-like uncharacterized protein